MFMLNTANSACWHELSAHKCNNYVENCMWPAQVHIRTAKILSSSLLIRNWRHLINVRIQKPCRLQQAITVWFYIIFFVVVCLNEFTYLFFGFSQFNIWPTRGAGFPSSRLHRVATISDYETDRHKETTAALPKFDIIVSVISDVTTCSL